MVAWMRTLCFWVYPLYIRLKKISQGFISDYCLNLITEVKITKQMHTLTGLTAVVFCRRPFGGGS